MSFNVDYTTTIDDVTIKCSKPFNELGSITVEDLLPYAISGIHDIGVGRAGLSCETFSNYTDIENNTPVEYINSSWSDVRVKYHIQYNPFVTNPHYGFTILTYGTDWQNINSTTENARLVLDIPIQKIYVEMPTYTKNTINKVNDGDASTVDSIDWYNTNDTGTVRTVTNNTAIPNLQILTVFVLSDSNFIIMNTTGQKGAPFIHTTYAWHGNTGNAAGGTSGTTNFLPYYSTTYLGNTARYVNMANDEALNNNTFGNVDWSRNFVVLFDTPDNEHEQTNSYVVITYTGAGPPDFNGTVTFYPKGGERSAMLGFANSCLKFKYGNTMYKPLIADGAVYDYTDDMTKESEFDDITTVTGNNVPLTPPSPPIPPESFDSDPSAYNDAYTTGVPSSQLYAMTLAQVNDMFDKLTNGGIIPANFEPGNAVISIQRYPFSLSSFASSVAGNITWTARPDVIGPETPTRIMFPPTGEEITGYPIYNPVKRVSLGSFKLSEFWTNYIAFLNREISASLYIPFCGIIEIDINAILNKTITVYLTIDVISGGCTAAVDINGCMYTTVSGSCSADMYFSTSNYGTIRAALRSNTAEQVYNVAQLAAGAIGAAATGGLTAGWATQAATGAGFNILGKAIKRTMMRNGVTPSVHGSAGDMSGWKLPMHCQLILSLPRPNHSSDSIYGHSHGFLTVSEKTVGSCSGLAVCDNPDVSNIGTATDTEKEMIYNMLQNGVYV